MTPAAFVFGLTYGGLAAVRALGRAGVPVVVIDWSPDTIGCVSRHCTFKCSPSPTEPERLLNFFIEEGKRLSLPGILLLAHDESALFVSRHRTALERYYRFTLPAESTMEAMVDKRRQYELARALGIACPDSIDVDTMEDVLRVRDQLAYPVLIKPLHSHQWRKRFPCKVFKVLGPEELAARYYQILPTGLRTIIQTLVVGQDSDLRSFCAYINREGSLLGACTIQKLRQCPIEFGEASLAVTVHDPEIAALGLRYALGVGFRGVCMVEFKRDERDGKWKLMELNPRFWSHTALAIDAGVNLPLLHYLDLAGETPAAQLEARAGVKWLHSIRDILSFWGYWRRKELSLWTWLKSWRGVSSYSAFAWDDPRPFLRQSATLLPLLKTKILKVLRGKSAAPAPQPGVQAP